MLGQRGLGGKGSQLCIGLDRTDTVSDGKSLDPRECLTNRVLKGNLEYEYASNGQHGYREIVPAAKSEPSKALTRVSPNADAELATSKGKISRALRCLHSCNFVEQFMY